MIKGKIADKEVVLRYFKQWAFQSNKAAGRTAEGLFYFVVLRKIKLTSHWDFLGNCEMKIMVLFAAGKIQWIISSASYRSKNPEIK